MGAWGRADAAAHRLLRFFQAAGEGGAHCLPARDCLPAIKLGRARGADRHLAWRQSERSVLRPTA